MYFPMLLIFVYVMDHQKSEKKESQCCQILSQTNEKYRVISVSGTRLAISAWRLRGNDRNEKAMKLKKGQYQFPKKPIRIPQFLDEDINSKLMPGKKVNMTNYKNEDTKKIIV